MTTYGTIPTSSSPGPTPPVNFEYISRAKERLQAGLGTRRPWREMFELHCFALPTSTSDAIERIKSNFSYFQMNYAIIVLIVLFISLLWNPISLIVFLVMMVAWVFLYFLRDEPLRILNRTISDGTVLIILSILTVVLLFFTHATANIVSSLLAGMCLVCIHAVFRKMEYLSSLDEEATGFLRYAAAVRGPPPPSS